MGTDGDGRSGVKSATTTHALHGEPGRVRRPASVGGAVALIVLWYLIELGAIMVVGVASDMGFHPPRITEVLLGQIIGWLIVLAMAARGSGAAWRDMFPLHPFSARLVPPLIVLCAGLSILLFQLASLIPMPESVRRMSDLYFGSPWYLLVMAGIILGPVFEEVFHRGWLLSGLRARYSTRKAILISSLIFAVSHGTPWQIVLAFPVGVLFAWLVVRTGSLVPSVLGHATVNATTGVKTAVLREIGYSDAQLAEMTFFPPALLAAAGLLAIVGWFLLADAVKRSSPPIDETWSGHRAAREEPGAGSAEGPGPPVS